MSRTKIRKTETWHDIKHYTNGIKCHICRTDLDVKRGIILGSYEFGNNILPLEPAYWHICFLCHYEDWRVERPLNSDSLCYYRIKKYFKLVKVRDESTH